MFSSELTGKVVGRNQNKIKFISNFFPLLPAWKVNLKLKYLLLFTTTQKRRDSSFEIHICSLARIEKTFSNESKIGQPYRSTFVHWPESKNHFPTKAKSDNHTKTLELSELTVWIVPRTKVPETSSKIIEDKGVRSWHLCPNNSLIHHNQNNRIHPKVVREETKLIPNRSSQRRKSIIRV